MKVLVIGAGAIGISVGASLAEAGVEVSFIDRREVAQAIRKDGVGRRGVFRPLDILPAQVQAYDDYADLPADTYDWVIISVKATANAAVSAALAGRRDVFRNGGKILLIQNGWGVNDPYLAFFDRSMLYNGSVVIGFEKDSLTVSRISAYSAPFRLGSLYGGETEGLEQLAALLRQAELPAEVSGELLKVIWAKLLYNTTINSLGAILGVECGRIQKSAHCRAIMAALIDETYAVMHAAGIPAEVPEADAYKTLFFDTLLPQIAAHHTSTLQDIRRKVPTEIDTLSGAVVKEGARYHVLTPTHEMICTLIHAMEDVY